MQTVSTVLHPQGADTPLSADVPADLPIVTRKIGDLILDPKINTREVDNEIVVEYKDAIQGYGAKWQDHWNELPRITESNHLWSGFHTLTAAQLVFSDRGEIRCIVEGENERDAYFFATRTNAHHGRQRSNAEKEVAVLRWLEDEEMCQWTDGYIAKMCHVSPKTVTNIRDRTQDLPSQPTKRKFINSRGDIEWMHTSRIGLTPAPPPIPADPEQQKKTDFNAYIKQRDAAHDAWKRYCDRHEIPFDWDAFCLEAEKRIGERGCVSAINPDTATLDQISEKSQIWQKITNAITSNAGWVTVYQSEIEHAERKRKEEAQAAAQEQRTAEREMREAYQKGEEAFKAHPLAKLIDFEIFEIEAAAYLDGEELEDPKFVHYSDADAYKELWNKVIAALNQNVEWVEQLLTKFSDTEDEEDVGAKEAEVTPMSTEKPEPAPLQIEPVDSTPATVPDTEVSARTRSIAEQVKTSLVLLIEQKDIKLILKYAAEDFLEILEAYMLEEGGKE